MTYTRHQCSEPAHLGARLLCAAIAVLFAGACATSPFHPGNRFDTTVMADLAWRCADSDFEPVDQQRAFGLETDVRMPHDNVGLELGLFHSSRSGTREIAGSGSADVDASMTEASVGGRWRYGPWILGSQPYAAAGASLLFVSAKSDGPLAASQSATDWTFGPYVRLGLEWPLTSRLSIALDYRQVLLTQQFREIRLDDLGTDANYSQVGLVLAWRF